jgi:VanZ family protein
LSRRRAFVLWGGVAAYAAVLTYVSGQAGAPAIFDYIWDKALHAAAYAGFALLLIVALHDGLRSLRLPRALAAAAVATAYGALEEVHQMLVPGRYPSFRDIVADAVGAALAVGLAYAIRGLLSRSRGVLRPRGENRSSP